jgi:hypothetical protein
MQDGPQGKVHPGEGGLQKDRSVQDQHQDAVQGSTKTEMQEEGKITVPDKYL